MKNALKLIALLLAVMMVALPLVACENKPEPTSGETSGKTSGNTSGEPASDEPNVPTDGRFEGETIRFYINAGDITFADSFFVDVTDLDVPMSRGIMAKLTALAMGLTDCDCIAEGKQADLVVIDMNRPSMQPVINIPKNLVYSGSKDCVKMTMIAGKVLYENGEFFTIDKERVIYELKRCAENLRK